MAIVQFVIEKKPMTVSDETKQVERFSDFLKNIGRKRLNVSKKLAKNVLSNPIRAADITANIATAAASRKFKKLLSSLPEVINFHHTRKGLYLENFV